MMIDKHIRPACIDTDAARILEIYNPYITDTALTFEYEPLTLDEFKQRMEGIMKQFPWIVYEEDGVLLGYAYCSPYHTRAAYQWNCEISIYTDECCHGKGIAALLYEAIFSLMNALGYYNIFATITSSNPRSLRFHEKMGFEQYGYYENIGYKFEKWYNITRMIKRIGDFSKTPQPVKNVNDIDFSTFYSDNIKCNM